ncbi:MULTISPECIES: PDZ domain-containing protein [Arthrobacter]|uniref:endopeptidase La n=2 Tax=Arthrobacter TaxID=1663 RepID=A0ABU9KJR5_9MICC|nr:PDZ domain-containing protein [Arthrobacter sp. YJM1]MDP5227192.1 PDZ domain-containing protein [Arthrobacter sp. YJM1]
MSEQFPPSPPAQPYPTTPGWDVPEPRRRRRFPWGLAIGVIVFGALGFGALMPLPYVIESPGPTYNTIGSVQDKRLISVSGHESFTPQGQLDLTTVYVTGGPSGRVTALDLLQAFFDSSKAVYNVDDIFPKGTTQQEEQKQNAADMTSSQENATAAALTELKIPFSQSFEIAVTMPKSPAEGKLKAGDVLESIDGKPVATLAEVRDALDASKGNAITVVAKRGSSPVTVKVTPTKDSTGRYVMGVGLKYDFDFPFSVKYQLDQVGGPSAGMMFTLGVIDYLSPGDLTGGKHIAGTGTISPDGTVGPIGGIAQKMFGAKAAGAGLFLAPASNCNDVVGHVPGGLTVVKVDTLKDALAAVDTYAKGGDLSKLPACTAG